MKPSGARFFKDGEIVALFMDDDWYRRACAWSRDNRFDRLQVLRRGAFDEWATVQSLDVV